MTSGHEYDETSVCSDELSLSLKIENRSSYGGIYSSFNDDNDDDQSITDYSNKHSDKDKKSETYPVTFIWDKEEKDIVYLTGSFSNWKQIFIMPKIDNIYSLTLPLPKGNHKFKFRINGIFMVNKRYPIIKDGENNICNYIENTNMNNSPKKNYNSDSEYNKSESESSNKSFSSEDSFEEFDEEENSYKRKRKKIRKMKKIKYSQKYPKKMDLNNYAPDIPYSYNYIYNLDVISKQGLIGKMQYYEPKENNILGDNCSYKKIGVLPAVEINHIHSNDSMISDNSIICSSFCRYRHKFITLLYYKSK